MHINVKKNTVWHALCCYSPKRNADFDTTDMCCSMKTELVLKVSSNSHPYMFRLTCMSQESVMCKKNQGLCILHSCSPLSLLLDLIGSSNVHRDLRFCNRIRQKSDLTQNISWCIAWYLFFCCYYFFMSTNIKYNKWLFTRAMSTFQDEVINGNVTPHWWTPDCFKYNLKQRHKEVNNPS